MISGAGGDFKIKMEIKEQVEDLQYQIKRVDGHTRIMSIGNRFHGALEIGLGVLWAYVGTKCNFPINIAPYAISLGFAIDGVGTSLTGKLHYAWFKVTKSHPKYKLEDLTKK